MIKHYLLIARRHLLRSGLLSLINIFGLSVGIATCLMMVVYVVHEMSFDRFNRQSNRIFIMCARAKLGPDTLDIDYMSYSSGPIISKADPHVESFERTFTPWTAVTLADPKRADLKFKEKSMLFADSNFFRFFSFHLSTGNVNNVLAAPYTMVISRKTALKYFGATDPVGKTLRYGKNSLFRITAVADDPPSNSSIEFDFVASLESLRTMQDMQGMEVASSEIDFGAFHTYLLLNTPRDKMQVERVIQQAYQRDKNPSLPVSHLYLTGLQDLHFNGKFNQTANAKYLPLVSMVAIVVLLLALVNYMSLATADSLSRGREVAVRKITGANIRGIRLQFYVESALYSLISFLVAFLILAFLGKPIFRMLGLSIDPAFIFSPLVLGLFIFLFVATAIIAGFYPSLVLSGLDPQAILSGRGILKHNGAIVRKCFTVLQFSLAVTTIIFCLIVNAQVHFFLFTNTGIARQNVFMVPVDDSVFKHFGAFKNDLATIPGVRGVAVARYPMYGGYDRVPVSANHSKPTPLALINVDENFIPLLGLQWKEAPKDTMYLGQNKKIILNESAVNTFNFPPDAAARTVRLGESSYFAISGVLRDFVFTNLKLKIEPLGLLVNNDSSFLWASGADARLFVRADAGAHLPELLESAKSVYAKYNNSTPFSFEFLDEVFDSQYGAEQRLKKILNICTPLIILIACFGLFGLVYFNVNRRLKEISIRKVLGAEPISIMALMCRDFAALILLSIIIACPIAWYVARTWLQNFQFRIQLGWPVFIVTLLGTILISFVTVLTQVLKAVNTNPARNLMN